MNADSKEKEEEGAVYREEGRGKEKESRRGKGKLVGEKHWKLRWQGRISKFWHTGRQISRQTHQTKTKGTAE